MFSINLLNWRHDPYVEVSYSQEKIEQLAIVGTGADRRLREADPFGHHGGPSW